MVGARRVHVDDAVPPLQVETLGKLESVKRAASLSMTADKAAYSRAQALCSDGEEPCPLEEILSMRNVRRGGGRVQRGLARS